MDQSQDTTLRDVIETDPDGKGFAALMAAGKDADIAAVFNDMVTGSSVYLGLISSQQFFYQFAAVVVAIGQLSPGSTQARFWDNVLMLCRASGQVYVGGPLWGSIEAQAIADALVPNQAAMDALSKREGTYAEVKLGVTLPSALETFAPVQIITAEDVWRVTR